MCARLLASAQQSTAPRNFLLSTVFNASLSRAHAWCLSPSSIESLSEFKITGYRRLQQSRHRQESALPHRVRIHLVNGSCHRKPAHWMHLESHPYQDANPSSDATLCTQSRCHSLPFLCRYPARVDHRLARQRGSFYQSYQSSPLVGSKHRTT